MSTRRRFFLLCLLPLLACLGRPQPLFAAPKADGTFTMERAVAQAMQANPGVEAKLLMMEQAKMNVGVAQSYFWPRVSLVAGTSRVENYEEVQTYNSDNLTSSNWNKGLRASLSLFAGFAHLNNLQKSRIAVEVEKARHQQARLELGSNVQLQFLQLLKCREDLKSAQEAVARIETQLKAAEAAKAAKAAKAAELAAAKKAAKEAKAAEKAKRAAEYAKKAEAEAAKQAAKAAAEAETAAETVEAAAADAEAPAAE